MTEYAREIMDAFNDPMVKSVVMMSSSQVAKSTVIENVIGYHIHHDPAPMMYLLPTLDLAEAFSKDRIAPMIRDTPAILARVIEAGSRRGGNTLLHKNFFGGHLTLTGANSPSSLAARPIRILLCDEVDRYDASAGTEGDPLNLATKRTTAFWNAKIGYFSSPGRRGTSRITELYQDSDQRRYYVPCPHCSEMHQILWENLHWTEGLPAMHEDGKPIRRAVEAWFQCPACSGRIGDVQRHRAVRKGEWRATAPFKGRAGFWLWQGYSPWRSALETANEWLAALGRPEQERTVINTVRGETYQERGEAPDWEKMKGRASQYQLGTAPKGVLLLTGGGDVQKDRVEVAVWGFGRGGERWLVDYIVLPGDTSRPEVWTALDGVIQRTWPHASGLDLNLSMTFIDAQYETTAVYDFARRWGSASVIAAHGRSSGQRLVWQSENVDYGPGGQRYRVALRPYNVNVSMAKSELYRQLNSDAEVVSRVHTPIDLPDELYKQICAEMLQTKYVKGYAKSEWVKVRERNEALDTANLARAAAAHIGIDQFQERNWVALESLFAAALEGAESAPETEPSKDVSVAPAKTMPTKRRKTVVNRYLAR